MTDGIRRKKKGSKKKSQEGSSGLMIAGIGAAVVIGIVVVVCVMMMNRPGRSPTNAAASNTANSGNASPTSTVSTSGDGAAGTSPTDPGADPNVFVPTINSNAQKLQDVSVADEQGRFDLRIPVGWKHKPGKDFSANFDTDKSVTGLDYHMQPYVTAACPPQNSNTLQSFMNTRLEASRKANQSVLSDLPAKVAGYDARRYIVEYPLPRDFSERFKLPAGQKSRQLTYVIGPVNECFLCITFETHNEGGKFDKLVPTFDAMMSTIRIPETTAAKQ